MSINLKGGLSIKTKYSLSVINTETGNERIFEPKNVVTAGLFKKPHPYYSDQPKFAPSFAQAIFGSGIAAPAETDTVITTPLWASHWFSHDSELIELDDTQNIVHHTYTYTVPAGTDYVGTISEIGIRRVSSYSTPLVVHALIYDAENNPITIAKTDLDIIILTANIDLVFNDGLDLKVIPNLFSTLRSLPSNFLCLAGGLAWLNLGNMYTVAHYQGYGNWAVGGSIGSMVTLEHSKNARSFARLNSSYVNLASYNTYAGWGYTGIKLLEDISASDAITQYADGGVFTFTRRIAQTEIVGTHYFKALKVCNIWEVAFPNSKVFPDYAINGIDIMVAVGGEVQAEPALPYWKAGTHVLYKNGIALVEGTDYTIDSNNNRTRNIELMACMEAFHDNVITAGRQCYQYVGYPQCRLYSDSTALSGGSPAYTGYHECSIASSLAQDATLLSEYAAGELLNTFQNPSSATSLKLEYSSDGITYIEEGTYAAGEHSITERSTTTYPFWRVTPTTGALSFLRLEHSELNQDLQDNVNSMLLLYYKGAPIEFTTALAAGDIITMDCSIDIPLKTDNNLIDLDMTINLLG